MLTREAIANEVASFFGIRFVHDGEASEETMTERSRIAAYTDDFLDWRGIIDCTSMLALLKHREIPMDEWDALGGNPSPTQEIDGTVLLSNVIDFLLETREVTVEDAVRRAVCQVRSFGDPDQVPMDYRFSDKRTWVLLRDALNASLKKFDYAPLANEAWKTFGKEKSRTVSEVIGFVTSQQSTAVAA